MNKAQTTKFTIIELLVVISVIAILVSMLMPALQKARISAKTLVCVNKLKQLGLAFHSYSDDNGGFLPRAQIGAIWPGTGPSWCSDLGRRTLLSPYLGSTRVVGNGEAELAVCPSDIHLHRDKKDYSGASSAVQQFSYGMNIKVALSRVSSLPSGQVMIGDKRVDSVMMHYPHINNATYPFYHTGRHSGAGNYCFIDGHVEPFKIIYMQRIGTTPAGYVGYVNILKHLDPKNSYYKK